MNTQPSASGSTSRQIPGENGSESGAQNDRPLVVAIDGDDTLWHNETLFVATHDKLRDLLAPYVNKPASEIDDLLLGFERRNLSLYGYGIKASPCR
jgi:hypothetical protein